LARKRCLALWADLARNPSLQPVFVESHLGLMCARGLIRVGSELRAMLVVGGIAPQEWPPSANKVQENVRNSLERMTNLVIKDINVNVQSIERG